MFDDVHRIVGKMFEFYTHKSTYTYCKTGLHSLDENEAKARYEQIRVKKERACEDTFLACLMCKHSADIIDTLNFLQLTLQSSKFIPPK